ncbi:Cysteine desulfurase [Candidatus Hodgkinia cicadicola]|uniref:Cysteine desulfurase n=1 Tax=Candidatus Hodgkinia cicadicola TaxID=573658 RepID=A0ABX4MGX2_9HYPH|nr:Cysteine desulfurase [Candidatus Hodgkinia cicadicola]
MEIIRVIYIHYQFNQQRIKILTCIDSNYLFLTSIYDKIINSDIEIIGLDSDFIPNVRQYLSHVINNVSLIILSHISNITGLLTPIRLYYNIKNKNAVLLIDGTKAFSNFNINIEFLNCDIYLISPSDTHVFTYINLCFIKSNLITRFNLEILKNKIMNKFNIDLFKFIFNVKSIVYNAYPARILDIIWLFKVYKKRRWFCFNNNKSIYKYLWSKLSLLKSISLIDNWNSNSTVICFRINNIPSFEIVTYLNKTLTYSFLSYHCLMSAIEHLKRSNVCKISIGLYNTFKDADILLYNIMQLCYLSELKVKPWIRSILLYNVINDHWSQFYCDPTITNTKLLFCLQHSSLQSWCLFLDKDKQNSKIPFSYSFTKEEYIIFNLLFVYCYNFLHLNSSSTYNFIVKIRTSIYKK